MKTVIGLPNPYRLGHLLIQSFVIAGIAGYFAMGHPAAAADATHTLSNFESKKQTPLAKNFTTHKANTTLVNDVPQGGGKFAAKTVVDAKAGAAGYFGTGYPIPKTDLSGASALRFWIKTDIKSDFNFQIHSDGNRVSAFKFSTSRAAGKWMQITARVASFHVPQWSQGKADWSAVNRWQITAFGNGPYDGKYIMIDNLVSAAKRDPTKPPAKKDGPVQRGGPIHLKQAATPAKPKSPPDGFRRLFDGKTLKGWTAMARIPVPNYPGADFTWRLEGDALKSALQNTGRWKVEDGAIVGGQEPPGSGKGAYLVSDEKFGDFELIMDMKPDWKTDSGFLVRTLPGGSPGMQILVDHRPQGGIGGFYGNGIAGIHGMPFAIDADYDRQGNPTQMIAARPDDERVELNKKTRGILEYAADVDAFLNVWNWGQWNTVKVRCEGRIPTLTTWVNGLKIAVLDMNDLEWKNYDKEACAKMLGRKGHISLEVHDNNFNHWLGKDRWWPGAVVRWNNIFIRELASGAASDDR